MGGQVGGPFTKLGPLRNVVGVAEISGHLSAAGLVLILTACLTFYGAVSFQSDRTQVGLKTLSGEQPPRCPPQPPLLLGTAVPVSPACNRKPKFALT